jgi:hypothetical protein
MDNSKDDSSSTHDDGFVEYNTSSELSSYSSSSSSSSSTSSSPSDKSPSSLLNEERDEERHEERNEENAGNEGRPAGVGVWIKTMGRNGKHFFLLARFNVAASRPSSHRNGRYENLGGRVKSDETSLEAARRVMFEKLRRMMTVEAISQLQFDSVGVASDDDCEEYELFVVTIEYQQACGLVRGFDRRRRPSDSFDRLALVDASVYFNGLKKNAANPIWSVYNHVGKHVEMQIGMCSRSDESFQTGRITIYCMYEGTNTQTQRNVSGGIRHYSRVSLAEQLREMVLNLHN